MSGTVGKMIRMIRSIALLAVLFGLLAATLSQAATAESGGNSENAHLCQKGGWASLSPSGYWPAFANQDECVSYGAQGGSLFDVQGIIIPTGHSATISGQFNACNALSAFYVASNGESGSLGAAGDGCQGGVAGPATTSVFATDVVINIHLSDDSCALNAPYAGWTFDAYGNHGLVTGISGGYLVDIMDSGLCNIWSEPRENGYPTPGIGNLSVTVIIN